MLNVFHLVKWHISLQFSLNAAQLPHELKQLSQHCGTMLSGDASKAWKIDPFADSDNGLVGINTFEGTHK